jgi:LysM repeat protein
MHLKQTGRKETRMPRSSDARRKNMLAIPAALATITSLIFGINAEALEADSPVSPELGQKDAPRPRATVTDSAPRAKSRDGSYEVREGDTISAIAASFGVSSVELLAANGLSWRTLIFAGQRLDIPRTTSGTAEHDRIDTVVRYRVATGDTLEAIARAHGVQPRALMSANGLGASSRLIVGQRLVVPNRQVMSEIAALA